MTNKTPFNLIGEAINYWIEQKGSLDLDIGTETIIKFYEGRKNRK